MKKFAAAFIWMMTLAVPSFAEPITAGSLSVPAITEPVDIALSGLNFSFNGVASPWCGVFSPLYSEFTPGSTVDLTARWTGTDLVGEARTADASFAQVGSLQTDTAMDALWSGTMSLHSTFAGGKVSSPFTFAGTFYFNGQQLDLTGRGMAVADFLRRENGSFALASLNYTFGEVTPNPEPASVILLMTGLGLLIYRRSARGVRLGHAGKSCSGGYGNWLNKNQLG